MKVIAGLFDFLKSNNSKYKELVEELTQAHDKLKKAQQNKDFQEVQALMEYISILEQRIAKLKN